MSNPAQGRSSRHTVSKAGEVFAGNLSHFGHNSGRSGAPLDNAVLRFITVGVPVKGAATLMAAASVTAATGATINKTAGVGTMHGGILLGRKIQVTSSGNDSANVMTISGADGSGRPQKEQLTLANAGVVTSNKGWSYIVSVKVSADTAGTISIGTVDIFEPPYHLIMKSQISEVKVGDTAVATIAGKLTVGVTAAQTGTNGSPKGLIDLSASSLSDLDVLTIDMMVFRGDNEEGFGNAAWE